MAAKGGYLKPAPGKPGKRRYPNSLRKAATRASGVRADAATRRRTRARLEVTGAVKGVDASDGITKQEARRVKQARGLQKWGRARRRAAASNVRKRSGI